MVVTSPVDAASFVSAAVVSSVFSVDAAGAAVVSAGLLDEPHPAIDTTITAAIATLNTFFIDILLTMRKIWV